MRVGRAVGMLLAGLALAGSVGCAERPGWRALLEGVGSRFISARDLKGMLDRGENRVLVDAGDEVRMPPSPPWT